MLPDQFRFVVENQRETSIDANVLVIKYRGKYFDSGKLAFESESADILSQSSTLASEAFLATSTIDNGAKTHPIVEADVFIEMDFLSHSTFPNGCLHFYIQKVTADTPVWPTNGELKYPDIFLTVDMTEWGKLTYRAVVSVN